MESQKAKRITFFLLLFIGFVPLSAINSLNYGHFTNENGLSNNSITFILQDRNKFIWIGTSDGLNLFNGYNFRIYRNIREDTTSLPDNDINTIFQDSRGILWIGTVHGGLCRFNPNTDAFVRIKYGDSGLTNNSITGIAEDKFHNLWVSTSWGLNCYNYTTGKIDRFFAAYHFSDLKKVVEENKIKFPSNFLHGIDSLSRNMKQIWRDDLVNFCEKLYGTVEANKIISNIVELLGKFQVKSLLESNVKTVCTSDDGKVWIGYEHEGLTCINPKELTFEHFSNFNRFNHKGSFVGVYRLIGIKNELYIAYNNGTANVFDIIKKQFKPIPNLSFSSRIVNFYSYGNQKLFIASENQINLLNVADKSSNIFLNQNELGDKEKEKTISYLFIDDQNNQWVGTALSGLFLINEPKGFHIMNKNNMLSKSSVTSICQDNKQNFWVGYSPEGLDLFSSSWVLKKHYVLNGKVNSTTFNWPVLSVYQDKSDSIWSCSYQNGIYRYNTKREEFSNISSGLMAIEKSQADDIRAFLDDGKGNIWLASQGQGLYKFTKKTGHFQRFKADYTDWRNNLPSDWIFDLALDKSGLIWIATSDGLSIFNPGSSKIKTFKRSNSLLVSDFINDIFIDSYDNVWIGTKGGLSIYNRKSDKFFNLKVEDGIPNNDIKAILESGNNTFWISTNGGLFSTIAYKDGKFDHLVLHNSIFKFDVYDGLSSNEFFDRSCLKDSKGNLYFGGNNGITFFNPKNIQLNRTVPNIVFTGLKLFNNPVLVNQKYGNKIILKKALTATDTILLDYQQNILTFEFVALNYIEPHKNQYKYRLSGFDSTWINLGNRNEINYTNLQYGTYVLTVKGSNNDGFWNKTGKSLTIIVKPPFWITVWFKISIILVIIFLIIGIYYVRLASIRKINRDLRIAVLSRTKELVSKNRILMEQTEELNYSNSLLEVRKQQIEKQKETLISQRDKLSHLNVTKDKLFSILAHDLRNPFNSIIGFSELLLTDLDRLRKDQITFYADIIHSSSVNGNDLLENLLQWSAAQTGRISFEPERLNLAEIVGETLSIFRGNVHRKNLEIIVCIDKDGFVYADRNMTKTILRNLISNAIKFTPLGGKIELSSIIHDHFSEFTVTDNGIGISPKNLNDLFHLTSNITTKGTANEPGTGLGLILCKEFVEMHKGDIWVNSIVNKGTSFHFTLPIS